MNNTFTIHLFSSFFFKPIVYKKNINFNSVTDNTVSDNIYKIYTSKYILYLPKSLLPINLVSDLINQNPNDTNTAFFKYLHDLLKINTPYDKFDNSYLVSYAKKNHSEIKDNKIITDISLNNLKKTNVTLKFDNKISNIPIYIEKAYIDIFELNKTFETLNYNNKYAEFTNDYVTFVMKYFIDDNIKNTISIHNIKIHKDNIKINKHISKQIFNMVNLLCLKHKCQLLRQK
jgi:hypothetical protein